MRARELHIAALAVGALVWTTSVHAQNPYGIGRPATPAEIAKMRAIQTGHQEEYHRGLDGSG